MKKLSRVKDRLLFLISVYTMGVFLELSFYFLRMLGRIKIQNWKGFPKNNHNPENNGLVVVSNHPSLLDPLLVSALFFPRPFLHPFKASPWNIAEERNYKKFFWRWAWRVIIFVKRGNKRSELRAFIKAQKVVQSGKSLVFFPEGRRTFKAGDDFLESPKGERIANLKGGVGLLVARTKAPVLIVWIQGSDHFLPNTIWPETGKSRFPFPRFWRRITIKIGPLVDFSKTKEPEEITNSIARELLKLADEN